MSSLVADINWTASVIGTIVLSVVVTVLFNVLTRRKK